MPHLIIEYTDNLKAEANIPELLAKLNDVLIQQGAFPIGGIRSRAIELQYYQVADGAEDDAFVHGQLKIGAGRTKEVKKATCDQLFEVMKAHFAEIYAKRSLALSLELAEFTQSTYKHNNIHQRYK